jgi:hypothetical protein
MHKKNLSEIKSEEFVHSVPTSALITLNVKNYNVTLLKLHKT